MLRPLPLVLARVGFAIGCAIGCAGNRAGAQDGAQRPNVVIIVSDDQGWADIGYNNPAVHSPNLDALAASSAVFTQHYVMPQCTPTRVALMTGRYPARFGGAALAASNAPAFPIGTPTLAAMFAASGYDTAMAGKWHLGSTPAHGPNHFGFASSYGALTGAVGNYDHRYRKGRFEHAWHRDGEIIAGGENGTHVTDLLTAEAIAVIERRRDGPFFLYLPFTAVHTPLDERDEHVDRPTQPDPENPGRWLDEDTIRWFHDPQGLIQRERDPEKRLLLAAVHHLDHAIGEITAALDRTGQRANTLLLFTSDNGPQVNWGGKAYPDDLQLTDFNQPLPFRGKKVDVYEGGIHVPGFANWPGTITPREIDAPVHVVDWFPTLAHLIGFVPQQPVPWDGIDIWPAVTGAALPARDLYWCWGSRINRWALRHGDWKIVRYGSDEPARPGDWSLFDLGEDPREQNDLALTRPEILAQLHARFQDDRRRDAK